jgi:hypothetical protein
LECFFDNLLLHVLILKNTKNQSGDLAKSSESDERAEHKGRKCELTKYW